VVFYDVLVGLPTALLVPFLGSHLPDSARRLARAGDRRVAMLFAFIWPTCLHLVRRGTQLWRTQLRNPEPPRARSRLGTRFRSPRGSG
jgi:hypothetical protein